MQIVSLYDEVALMTTLQKNTVDLIHATTLVKVIQKLVYAHEIIDLNLKIEKRFENETEPPWDIPALSDLSKIRRELIVYHRLDFNPTALVERYSNNMKTLFKYITIRKNLSNELS